MARRLQLEDANPNAKENENQTKGEPTSPPTGRPERPAERSRAGRRAPCWGQFRFAWARRRASCQTWPRTSGPASDPRRTDMVSTTPGTRRRVGVRRWRSDTLGQPLDRDVRNTEERGLPKWRSSARGKWLPRRPGRTARAALERARREVRPARERSPRERR